MRWFSRRSQPVAPKGRHAAGRAGPAETVSTPDVFATTPVAWPSVRPLVAAPVGDCHEAAPVQPGSGVHLGFADGGEHELASGDPRVTAFRAVARTLVGV
jgi:hypothetical protein